MPRSNFFIATNDNKIITPSKNILKGVMRSKLIEIAKKDFVIEERQVSINEINLAREAFITSTTKTILPVRQINGHIFHGKFYMAEQLYHSLSQLVQSQVV